MARAADEREARNRLVEAGVRLVRDHFASPDGGNWAKTLAWMHPAVVAEEAGYRSRGMIYRIWGSGGDGERAFEAFLGEVMESFRSSVTDAERLSGDAIAMSVAGMTVAEVIEGAVAVEWDRLTSAEHFADWSVMVATMFSSRGGHAWDDYLDCCESGVDRLVAMYRAFGATLGLAPRAGLEWRDVAVTVMSILDGMLLNRLIHPEDFERTVPSPFGDGELHLAQLAVRAVFESMVTETELESAAPAAPEPLLAMSGVDLLSEIEIVDHHVMADGSEGTTDSLETFAVWHTGVERR